MPNWCNNLLDILGDAESIAAFKEQARGKDPWPTDEKVKPEAVLNFHSLIPIPKEMLKDVYDLQGYHWERENWGCKWGACEAELWADEVDGLQYQFLTAWTPPLKFIKNLGPLWPSLRFILEYGELGEGFRGEARAEGAVFKNRTFTH